MNQILVSEDALNSIKAMAQKLQEQNDRMRSVLEGTNKLALIEAKHGSKTWAKASALIEAVLK